MAVKFQHRRDTAANWASVDPVLAEGERALDTTNRRWKTGDGATAWTGLSYDEKAFTPRGSYNDGTAYLQDDLVLDQGSSWVALQSTTGNAPPTLPTESNAYWQLVALSSVGADGFVAGKRLTFSDATTDGDPGDGTWRRNHATFSSVTELYIDNEDNGANSIAAWLDSLDDGATTADRGRLLAVKADDPDVWEEYKVTGTVTDGTGYRKVAVTPIGDGAAFTDSDEVVFVFHATGSAGADGAGAVDSVNSQTGAVVLDPDDLDDSATTHKFATAAQLATVDYITVTGAVNLDNIDTRVNQLDAAVVIVGTWDPTSGSFPGGGTAQAGASYVVTADGTVDGVEFKDGDRVTAIVDNASTSTYAANWLHQDYTDRVTAVAGKTGNVTLDKTDVGLGNLDNTSDADKPVSTAQQTALNGKATKAALEGLNTQTGTTYTLVLADAGKAVEMNNGSANTLTVPPNSSVAFPVGTQILVRQLGAGQTTIAEGAGVTIRSKDDNLKLDGQYVEATLTKRATDEWVLTGALAP